MISAATLLSFERVRRGSRFPFSLLASNTATCKVGRGVDDSIGEAGAALPAPFCSTQGSPACFVGNMSGPVSENGWMTDAEGKMAPSNFRST